MTTLFYLAAYAVSGLLFVRGAWQLLRYSLLTSRCTEEAQGVILDTAERQSILSWPSTRYYYPIFQYDDKSGETHIFASDSPAQHKDQIVQGKTYAIRYNPLRPARFYSPEWDSQARASGVWQMVFGLLIAAITFFTA